ncbi:MAG TPA: hypothetical protein ENF48_10135 [Desulfobacteraceae bacterium]|nr:hypothetical protein [Deltaproteobacteria bacterium]HDI60688.1 hypothetical protein [Desulfobacteraceae bacterium]
MPTDASAIDGSLAQVRRFVAQTTGTAPTDEELADALGRYFVMKEIADHIAMVRGGESGEG